MRNRRKYTHIWILKISLSLEWTYHFRFVVITLWRGTRLRIQYEYLNIGLDIFLTQPCQLVIQSLYHIHFESARTRHFLPNQQIILCDIQSFFQIIVVFLTPCNIIFKTLIIHSSILPRFSVLCAHNHPLTTLCSEHTVVPRTSAPSFAGVTTHCEFQTSQ